MRLVKTCLVVSGLRLPIPNTLSHEQSIEWAIFMVTTCFGNIIVTARIIYCYYHEFVAFCFSLHYFTIDNYSHTTYVIANIFNRLFVDSRYMYVSPSYVHQINFE